MFGRVYIVLLIKENNTIDCFFSKNRDKKTAIKFFINSICSSGKPQKVNVDKSGSNTYALEDVNFYLPKPEKIEIRQNKYLNNIVEQDHRFIKKITRATLGFKAQYSAAATLDGIELHHMLSKGQHIESSSKTIFEQFHSLVA